MTLPFDLPAWVPPWVAFALLVVAVFLGLALLLMPFSVFGLKGRLDAIEARLDEIQGEIRSLVLRLPERAVTGYETEPEIPVRQWAEPPARPPIPPRAPVTDRPPPPVNRRVEPARQFRSGPSRSEPRFDPN